MESPAPYIDAALSEVVAVRQYEFGPYTLELPEEAAPTLRISEVEAPTVEDVARLTHRLTRYADEKGLAYYKTHFLLGGIYHTAQERHGLSLRSIAEKVGRSHEWVSQRAGLFRHFGGQEKAMVAWFEQESLLRANGVTWTGAVVKGLLERYQTPEEKVETAMDRVEYHGAMQQEALDTVRQMLPEDDPVRQAMEQAVLEQRLEEVELRRRLAEEEKPTTPRDDRYLAHVRSFGCCVCGDAQADAHHAFGQRGTASKPSDYATVGLCRTHHTELHQIGRDTFCEKYDLDLFEIAYNLLHHYVSGQWATLQLG